MKTSLASKLNLLFYGGSRIHKKAQTLNLLSMKLAPNLNCFLYLGPALTLAPKLDLLSTEESTQVEFGI